MGKTLISGFGVTGFRSFDDELQPLHDLQQINLFVGRNNAGKSNVIAATRLFCLSSSGEGQLNAQLQKFLNDPLNRSMTTKSKVPLLWLQLPKSAEALFKNYADWNVRLGNGQSLSAASAIKSLLTQISAGISTQGFIPVSFIDRRAVGLEQSLLQGYQHKYGDADVYRQIFDKLSGLSGGGVKDWVQFFAKALDPGQKLSSINFVEIPSVRKVIDAGSAFDGTFGANKIIHTIAEWERPAATNLDAYSGKMRRLLDFIRAVLEDSAVELQVPYQRDTIHVVKDGRTLPIERLGTGIHQVVMLAAAATVVENSVVAIEEPETNLHPALQRKLLRYLSRETSNQYFITTHSAHILDAEDAAVFQVSLTDGVSKLSRVTSSTQRFSAVEDLGYRASDLIQTPIVIWVEGPSDRIYLTNWIAKVAHELAEGIHYSVMFYGGRLLSHLKASDPEVDQFISLRRLNRYVVVVIDSDRKIATATINDTKKRIVEDIEMMPAHSHAWVTDGREIENYLDESTLENTLREMASDFASMPERPGTGFRFGNVLEYIAKDGSSKDVGSKKVAVARKYLELSNGLIPSSSKLMAQLERVIALVRKANGFA